MQSLSGRQPRQGWCLSERQRCRAAPRSPPASSLAIVNKDLAYLHQHAGRELESVREAHDLVRRGRDLLRLSARPLLLKGLRVRRLPAT